MTLVFKRVPSAELVNSSRYTEHKQEQCKTGSHSIYINLIIIKILPAILKWHLQIISDNETPLANISND